MTSFDALSVNLYIIQYGMSFFLEESSVVVQNLRSYNRISSSTVPKMCRLRPKGALLSPFLFDFPCTLLYSLAARSSLITVAT